MGWYIYQQGLRLLPSFYFGHLINLMPPRHPSMPLLMGWFRISRETSQGGERDNNLRGGDVLCQDQNQREAMQGEGHMESTE